MTSGDNGNDFKNRHAFTGMFMALTRLKLMPSFWALNNNDIDQFALNCMVDGIIKIGSQGENSNTSITKEL